MPKQPTIRRDSVFRSTNPDKAERHNKPQGQGASDAERSMRQTAVWLSDDELDWLDQECRKIRRGGWRSINRSIVIRSILEARIGIELDYGGIRSERDLSDHFRDQSVQTTLGPA